MIQASYLDTGGSMASDGSYNPRSIGCGGAKRK